MKTTKEMAEVMLAFASGKEIEFRLVGDSGDDGMWVNTTTPKWDWCSFDYRIKPKYRFITCEEVLEKLRQTGFAVRHIRNNKVFTVTEISPKDNYIVTVGVVKTVAGGSESLFKNVLGFSKLSPKQMNDNFVFLDGSGFMVVDNETGTKD